MRVLITGSTGFVGKNLIEELSPCKFVELITHSSATVDLTRFDEVYDYFLSEEADYIVHLAARVGGITDNANNQKEFLETNLLINTNVIKVADQFKIPTISLSSSCCYPVYFQNVYPLKEEQFYIGNFEKTNYTYALAKACMMKQIELSENRHVCIIPCNLIGKHDHFGQKGSHFVPSMITKLLTAKREGKKKIELLGDGTPVRQFCDVRDVCELITKLLRSDESVWRDLGKFVNIGPQRSLTIKEAAEIIRDKVAPDIQIKFAGGLNGIMRKDISDAKLQEHYRTFYDEPYDFEYYSFEETIDGIINDQGFIIP